MKNHILKWIITKISYQQLPDLVEILQCDLVVKTRKEIN